MSNTNFYNNRSEDQAIQMAGSLFSHVLNHLKQKEQTQQTYLLTPQKAGAFTRLSPVKRDNESSYSTTMTPIHRPVAVSGMPVFGTVSSFE